MELAKLKLFLYNVSVSVGVIHVYVCIYKEQLCLLTGYLQGSAYFWFCLVYFETTAETVNI